MTMNHLVIIKSFPKYLGIVSGYMTMMWVFLFIKYVSEHFKFIIY